MRAHIIENGVVLNTIEVDSLDFMPGLVAAPEGTGIGWSYDGTNFTDNRPKPEPEPAITTPTKEQLLAQLQALQAQIQALE